MTKIHLAGILATVLLVACTTAPIAPPVAPSNDSRAVIDAALKKVDQLPEHTRSADSKAKPAVAVGDAISITYAGDARALLKQVAASRGMDFKVRGPEPHLPLFVVVEVKGVSLEEFLTDIGYQFGQRADVALTAKAFEVRYRGQ